MATTAMLTAVIPDTSTPPCLHLSPMSTLSIASLPIFANYATSGVCYAQGPLTLNALFA